jgi:3',5'-nucleoside bisphosphate phosphatase
MKWYRADLHIHSVLSPCGDLDMSPVRIIKEAKQKQLDIIAITDHNATHHASLMVELGKKEGITVFPGVEINTREEVHCLAFFEDLITVQKFQEYIELKLPVVKNDPKKFGMQLVVNENEEILQEYNKLLIIALEASIEEIEKQVHELGGVFIPAHIDRLVNGIYSQIGFIPESLLLDALEVSNLQNLKQLENRKNDQYKYAVIQNSDAHNLESIGSKNTNYYLEEPTFKEWLMALRQTNGRQIKLA